MNKINEKGMPLVEYLRVEVFSGRSVFESKYYRVEVSGDRNNVSSDRQKFLSIGWEFSEQNRLIKPNFSFRSCDTFFRSVSTFLFSFCCDFFFDWLIVFFRSVDTFFRFAAAGFRLVETYFQLVDTFFRSNDTIISIR